MKNPFKRKKNFPTPPTPRSREEIMKDYNQLVAQAGTLQYSVYAYETKLGQLNQQLANLNYEMDARQKLDAEVAAAGAEQSAKVAETVKGA